MIVFTTNGIGTKKTCQRTTTLQSIQSFWYFKSFIVTAHKPFCTIDINSGMSSVTTHSTIKATGICTTTHKKNSRLVGGLKPFEKIQSTRYQTSFSPKGLIFKNSKTKRTNQKPAKDQQNVFSKTHELLGLTPEKTTKKQFLLLGGLSEGPKINNILSGVFKATPWPKNKKESQKALKVRSKIELEHHLQQQNLGFHD